MLLEILLELEVFYFKVLFDQKNLEGIAGALYKHLKKEESGTSVAYLFDKLSLPHSNAKVLLSFSPLRIRLCL